MQCNIITSTDIALCPDICWNPKTNILDSTVWYSTTCNTFIVHCNICWSLYPLYLTHLYQILVCSQTRKPSGGFIVFNMYPLHQVFSLFAYLIHVYNLQSQYICSYVGTAVMYLYVEHLLVLWCRDTFYGTCAFVFNVLMKLPDSAVYKRNSGTTCIQMVKHVKTPHHLFSNLRISFTLLSKYCFILHRFMKRIF